MISNYKKSFSVYWFICVLYTMSIVIVDCFMPQISQIMHCFDIKYNLAVLLITIESLAFFLCIFFVPKKSALLFFSGIAFLFGNILCFLSNSFFILLLGRFIMSFGSALIQNYAFIWVLNNTTNPFRCINGIYFVLNTSLLISITLGIYISNWRNIFLLFALMSFLSILFTDLSRNPKHDTKILNEYKMQPKTIWLINAIFQGIFIGGFFGFAALIFNNQNILTRINSGDLFWVYFTVFVSSFFLLLYKKYYLSYKTFFLFALFAIFNILLAFLFNPYFIVIALCCFGISMSGILPILNIDMLSIYKQNQLYNISIINFAKTLIINVTVYAIAYLNNNFQTTAYCMLCITTCLVGIGIYHYNHYGHINFKTLQ